jgi:hypothetical protein
VTCRAPEASSSASRAETRDWGQPVARASATTPARPSLASSATSGASSGWIAGRALGLAAAAGPVPSWSSAIWPGVRASSNGIHLAWPLLTCICRTAKAVKLST